MKFCTGALKKMAEIMVEERNKIGANGLGIHEVETRLCELVREVGVQVLGMEDEPLWERGVDCE